MIDFRLSSRESLDMYPDTTMSMEINNPLFEIEIKGTLVFPFDFPETPGNRKKLGFPSELLNTTVVGSTIAADLYIAGILFKSGFLKILKVVNSRITTSFISGAGSISEIIGNKTLKDIDYGNAIPFSGSNTHTFEKLTWGPAFTIGLSLDVTFNGVTTTISHHYAGFGDAAFKFTELYKAFKADTAGLAANHIIQVQKDINLSATPDYYRLLFLFEEGATVVINTTTYSEPLYGSFQEVSGFILDPVGDYMKEISLLSYPDADFAFPMIKAEDIYDGTNLEWASYINKYDTVNQRYYVNASSDGSRTAYSAVPFIYFFFVWNKVLDLIGYRGYGAFMTDEDIAKLIIFNDFLLDSLIYDSDDTIAEVVINKWSDDIDLKNHVPDMSITDFLKAVKNFFNLGFFINDSNRSIEFVPLEDVISSGEYDDWTSLTEQSRELDFNSGDGFTLKLPTDLDDFITENVKPLPSTPKASVTNSADLLALADQAENDIRLVTSLDQYWICYKYTSGGGYALAWKFFSENYYNYVVGLGKQEIPLISTLLMEKTDTLLNPVLGGSASGGSFPLRLLTYHGMQGNSTGALYPLASNGYKKFDGSVIGSLSLKPAEPIYGIHKKYYQNWLNFQTSARLVKYTCHLDIVKLINPGMKRKKRINNVEFIIKKINVTITMTGIKPATVEYYTV